MENMSDKALVEIMDATATDFLPLLTKSDSWQRKLRPEILSYDLTFTQRESIGLECQSRTVKLTANAPISEKHVERNKASSPR